MDQNSEIKIIHIKLVDEAVNVWRPVFAREVQRGKYMVMDQDIPDFEIWEFLPGQTVSVEGIGSGDDMYLRAMSINTISEASSQ
jgi:hypothetical protein